MSPVGLDALLKSLPVVDDPHVLVGPETSDDAGVYRLDDERALVVTADVITPPVDDPRQFGRIAAANALSDVWAMGGRPLTGVNIVGFPAKVLGLEVLVEMVAGASDALREAGAALLGGHTTRDDEPKMGLAVTGIVHPDRIWRNGGALPGDVLVLTKPIGTGVIFNGNLQGKVSEADLVACAASAMTLNLLAFEVLETFAPHAVTDVTGFGLAGHLFEMARQSEATLVLEAARVPILAGAREAIAQGVRTGADRDNRRRMAGAATWREELDAATQQLMVDPQTSGGLLAAVPADRAAALVARLHDAGVVAATVVGEAIAPDGVAEVVIR